MSVDEHEQARVAFRALGGALVTYQTALGLPVTIMDLFDEPTLTIRGVDYKVTECSPDGIGGIVLRRVI